MKRGETALVILLIVFGLVYQASESKDGFLGIRIDENLVSLASDQYFEYAVEKKTFLNIKQLTLDNPAGDVDIELVAGTDLLVQAVIRIYHDEKAKADELHGKVNLSMQPMDANLRINSVFNFEKPLRRARIFYRIAVPALSSIDVKNAFGNVTVRQAGQPVVVSNRHGRTTITDAASSVWVNQQFGSLEIQRAGAVTAVINFSPALIEGVQSAKLEGRHSECVVRDVKGGVIVNQSFGDLKVENAESVELDARNTDVILRTIAKGVKATHRHNDLLLEDVRGECVLDCAYSDIQLLRAKITSMSVKNENGSLEALDMTGQKAIVRVRHCDTHMALLGLEDSLDIDGYYSNVSISFPEKLQPGLTLRCRYGNIENRTRDQFSITEGRHEALAQVTRRGPQIEVRTHYGDITLADATHIIDVPPSVSTPEAPPVIESKNKEKTLVL